jgi:pimeloyl-ACP methyl ester carboxylesterase
MRMPRGPNEIVIENGSARLVVRDHGGDGRPLLLLHGYTGTRYDFAGLRPHLEHDHRLVDLELRGHGRSTADSWSWGDAVSDLEVAIERLQIPDAAVVGFSLGGMVAACYARAHAEAPAVVNVDGYGIADLPRDVRGRAETGRRLEALRAFRRSRVGRTMTQAELDDARERAAASAADAGRSPAEARQAMSRRVRPAADGMWERLPPPTLAVAMLDATGTIELLPVYAQIECPLLTVLALEPDGAPRPDLSWVPEFHAAQIAWLGAELRRLAGTRPNLELAEFHAPHVRLLDRRDVAETIREFSGRRAPSRVVSA